MTGIPTHCPQRNQGRRGKKCQSSPINEFSLEGAVKREGERKGQIKNESESPGKTTPTFALPRPPLCRLPPSPVPSPLPLLPSLVSLF